MRRRDSRQRSSGRRRTSWLGLCLGVGLWLGCQTDPSDLDRDVGAARAQGQCFPITAVRAFSALDERRILVDTRPQRIVEVYSDCDGLLFAQDIAVEGRAGYVCDYRGDKLIVDGRRCTIASILVRTPDDPPPASADPVHASPARR